MTLLGFCLKEILNDGTKAPNVTQPQTQTQPQAQTKPQGTPIAQKSQGVAQKPQGAPQRPQAGAPIPTQVRKPQTQPKSQMVEDEDFDYSDFEK